MCMVVVGISVSLDSTCLVVIITFLVKLFIQASDDLFYPGIFELIFKLVWFVPQVYYYTQYQTDFQCAEISLLHMYYLGYLCLMAIAIIMHLFIVYFSSKGTITQDEPRRHITKIIYFRSCHVALELIWSLLGIVWLTTVNWNSCKRLVYIIVLANILFCLFSVFLLIIILVIIFDPLSHLPEHDITRKRDILYDRLKKIFFCCYCCLYTGGGGQSPNYENSYKQISSILEMIFRGGNLVPSDVLAGIILLSNKEVDQYKRESTIKTLNSLEISKIPKWMNINESCYYVRYAIATYSWPYYIYMNNIKGCGEICCTKSLFCCCCVCTSSSSVSISIDDSVNGSSKAIIHGDSNTGRHLKAFKFLSKIDECDLVYANFQNELFLVPFCVLVDHSKKTIVITIRGTLSMR
jgi:sn1-specific diacylglycerol lipase